MVTYLFIYEFFFYDELKQAVNNYSIDEILLFLQNQEVNDKATLRILSNNPQLKSIKHLENLEKFAEALEACFLSPSGIDRKLLILLSFVYQGEKLGNIVEKRSWQNAT